VGLTSADCQLPIVNWPLGIEAIGNRKSAITRPTRYRGVVLTSLPSNRPFLSNTLMENHRIEGDIETQKLSLASSGVSTI
jgi:hypothetical protein